MKRAVITMGDPAGVGPEIALKSLAADTRLRDETIIAGSAGILEETLTGIGADATLEVIGAPEDFVAGAINVLDVLPLDYRKIPIGQVSERAGDAAYRYLERAIGLSMEGRVGPIVTAPLNKEALHRGGHKYDGHKEIFATLTGTKNYTMMLWSEVMSVVHVSTHTSLRNACDRVTKQRVLDCIRLGHDALKKLGVAEPKIACAGLNPHSGEAGLFGTEDRDEIRPAVEAAVAEGIHCEGPVPPDTVFLKATQKQYDLVVAMYHDQGHIPMKLLAFDSGVNVTLGLPIIRTSVDHGTAFDIAGKGIAREESLLWAIRLANRFAHGS